ncbi:hypothetical protein F5Y18DRAFT_429080 [Xylariaceae sp. FL1019]|nr:hypothetical protein F5Y18DRAFT_429080 [Xylariaceae sp. FL1019]
MGVTGMLLVTLPNSELPVSEAADALFVEADDALVNEIPDGLVCIVELMSVDTVLGAVAADVVIWLIVIPELLEGCVDVSPVSDEVVSMIPDKDSVILDEFELTPAVVVVDSLP